MVYSRTAKDIEQPLNSEDNHVSNALHSSSGVTNGQSSLKTSSVNNVSDPNTSQKSKTEFDPVEATRQIKNVIGIGQFQQQQHQNNALPQPLMDIKPLMNDQQTGQQQKSNTIPSKSFGQTMNTKVTPPPSQPQRIPHQPVIFSDRFDGGMNKIDIQFGNLTETLEDTPARNPPVSISPSSTSAFYQRSEPITSMSQQNNTSSTFHSSQRPTTLQHSQTEQSAFVSPLPHANSTRSFEQQQQPVMNQHRVLPSQVQHPQQQQQQQQQQQPSSMSMKPVVPTPYAVHPSQHQMNASNVLLQSLLFHHPQQESIPLDAPYDPTTFQLSSFDFNTPYYMAAMSQQPPPQQQTQARYLVHQPSLQPQQQQQQQQQPQQQQQQQQQASNRSQTTTNNNIQTSTMSNSSSSHPSSSTSSTLPTAPKKGPAVPPGIFLSTAPPTQPVYSTAYSAAYGIPPSVGGQQQTGATTYSTPYDNEQLFTNAFIQLTGAQQAQSPSGTYGSVTPPVQHQNQQTHNNNDNKGMNYRGPVNDDLVLLQQYQQFSLQQMNSQQQGQQAGAHSTASLSYFLGHPPNGPSYSPGPPIVYAQPTAAMPQQQQQTSKQQGQHYNQSNSSSGAGVNDDYYSRNSSNNKDARYMYTMPTQAQPVPSHSVGQQSGMNKQQQQRNAGNVYNNQQRSFQ
ncbi:unnamed protein product [Adineta ricciae]|nr:unnamed protein product [Adineta ricciae]